MLSQFEKNIGYTFKNKSLLENALTHTSYVNENARAKSNERLEFLGDSILGFLTTMDLYGKNKDKSEGELTRMRASLVCETNLAKQSELFSLSDFVLLGKGERVCNGHLRPSILSDSFEAVIASIFLDGGIEAAKAFVSRFVLEQASADESDPKTELQEHAQRKAKCTPIYRLISESGPEHEKEFVCQVLIDEKVAGEGKGRSKKAAEQEAAREALKEWGHGA